MTDGIIDTETNAFGESIVVLYTSKRNRSGARQDMR